MILKRVSVINREYIEQVRDDEDALELLLFKPHNELHLTSGYIQYQGQVPISATEWSEHEYFGISWDEQDKENRDTGRNGMLHGHKLFSPITARSSFIRVNKTLPSFTAGFSIPQAIAFKIFKGYADIQTFSDRTLDTVTHPEKNTGAHADGIGTFVAELKSCANAVEIHEGGSTVEKHTLSGTGGVQLHIKNDDWASIVRRTKAMGLDECLVSTVLTKENQAALLADPTLQEMIARIERDNFCSNMKHLNLSRNQLLTSWHEIHNLPKVFPNLTTLNLDHNHTLFSCSLEDGSNSVNRRDLDEITESDDSPNSSQVDYLTLRSCYIRGVAVGHTCKELLCKHQNPLEETFPLLKRLDLSENGFTEAKQIGRSANAEGQAAILPKSLEKLVLNDNLFGNFFDILSFIRESAVSLKMLSVAYNPKLFDNLVDYVRLSLEFAGNHCALLELTLGRASKLAYFLVVPTLGKLLPNLKALKFEIIQDPTFLMREETIQFFAISFLPSLTTLNGRPISRELRREAENYIVGTLRSKTSAFSDFLFTPSQSDGATQSDGLGFSREELIDLLRDKVLAENFFTEFVRSALDDLLMKRCGYDLSYLLDCNEKKSHKKTVVQKCMDVLESICGRDGSDPETSRENLMTYANQMSEMVPVREFMESMNDLDAEFWTELTIHVESGEVFSCRICPSVTTVEAVKAQIARLLRRPWLCESVAYLVYPEDELPESDCLQSNLNLERLREKYLPKEGLRTAKERDLEPDYNFLDYFGISPGNRYKLRLQEREADMNMNEENVNDTE